MRRRLKRKNLEMIRKKIEDKIGVSLGGASTEVRSTMTVIWLRPVRVGLIVTLMLALIGAAVVTASRRTQPEYGYTIEDSHFAVGETGEGGSCISGINYLISITLPANPMAPSGIEDFYLPQITDRYEMSFCYLYGFDGLANTLYTNHNVPDFGKSGIIYKQISITDDYCSPEAFVFKTYVMADETPEQITLTLGDVTGILLSKPDAITGRKTFCWSNGDYAYSLEVPYFFTEEQLKEIVSSVQLVEDIRPYLADMPEERIEELLG